MKSRLVHRYRKDRVYLCGSTIVCLFQAGGDKTYRGERCFPPRLYFLV
jgi:hypothetical protein